MAVTFTRTARTEDRSTGQFTVSTSTITGAAIKVQGDPVRYRDLGLVESESPTLYFVPTTYGDTIDPGDTVTWASTEYTAADVFNLAPDGVTIASRVIIRR